MPYIKKERIAEIRSQIRKEFPSKDGWNISVTWENYSGVRIKILAAPVKLTDKDHENVNHHSIDTRYKDEPERLKVFARLNQIANEGNGIEVEDGDYGSVPDFYVWIQVGEWNKPFVYHQKQIA
jgi:hypothetical protein